MTADRATLLYVRQHARKRKSCPKVTTEDGVNIYFKDWGSGQPAVLSHGWPLTVDAWDGSLQFVADRGFRALAHDRRGGGGRSEQPWEGNDLDHYADELAAVQVVPIQAAARKSSRLVRDSP